MITARKSGLFEKAFDMYNRSLLQRHFHRIMVRGAGPKTFLHTPVPTILFANHSNWWDGLVAYHLSREVLRVDAYAMMEERQLRRYRFFRRLGAFSVDREHPRSAGASLAYAAGLLDRPGRALWIFPQGVMEPNDRRPLRFFPGLADLARRVGRVCLVPAAFRYEFLMEQRPDCFVSLGEPLMLDRVDDRKSLTGNLERRLTGLLDDLRDSVVQAHHEGFFPVLEGRSSVNALLDRALLRGDTR